MVARIFLVAGTTVGAIGTSFGIAVRAARVRARALYGYPLDPKVYLIGQLPVQVAPREIIAVAAATLAICFLATLYPSLRASRLRAVDGLALQLSASRASFGLRGGRGGGRRAAGGERVALASYLDGHFAMMPSGTTSSMLSAAERALGDDLGALLERVGHEAGVRRADDAAGGRGRLIGPSRS